MTKQYTEEQYEAIGAAIAKELKLKHDREFPDRYPLTGGTKTNIGLAKTVRRIFDEAPDDPCVDVPITEDEPTKGYRMNQRWKPINTAPKDTVILTEEGTACYVTQRGPVNPSTNGWYVCTADGYIPCCKEDGHSVSEVEPKVWMPLPSTETQEVCYKDTLMAAMHIVDGLVYDTNPGDITEAWGEGGAIELYDHLTQYAEYCAEIARKGYEEHGDFPGVFDYEVSSAFGGWFGRTALKLKDLPSDEAAKAEIDRLAKEFWASKEN